MSRSIRLEHRAKKWVPVFSFKRCDNNNLERADDSHFALPALAAALLISAGAFPLAPVANAQSDSANNMNLVIVYGDDACPTSKGDEITVCARKPESERYRIPEGLRDHPSPQNEAWTNRVTAYERVGSAGTQSCSAVGAGGWTGCMHDFVANAYAEKKGNADTHFSEMVAQERQKREATIDAQAAKTQAQVEAAEKAQDAGK